MKITGEHQFTHSADQVWKALLDPAALTATLPGARRLEPTGPDEYAVSVDVGVGSVKGTYDGTFALTDKQEPEACTVKATASGRPGTVSVVAKMRMADDGNENAVLTYEADATVTGPLAGVGQRLMGAAARRTTSQFLQALDGYISEPEAVAEPEIAAAGDAQPRYEIERARPAGDSRVIVTSALAGFVLALVGVAVGRWTARR
jgi:carbon monoxide dehydrogenase subunit G